VRCSDEFREAVRETFAVLVRGMFGEPVDPKLSADSTPDIGGRGTPGKVDVRLLAGRLEEGRLANVALDVHGGLVGLELRLGRALGLLRVALTLLRGLGSL